MTSRTAAERDPADLALDWAQSTLARTVALKIVPWMLPTIGLLLAWLQDAIGLNLDPEVVATAVGAGMIGAAGVVLQWVRNHGKGSAELAETLLMTSPIHARADPPGLSRCPAPDSA